MYDYENYLPSDVTDKEDQYFELMVDAYETGRDRDFFNDEYRKIFNDLENNACENPMSALLAATDKMTQEYIFYKTDDI